MHTSQSGIESHQGKPRLTGTFPKTISNWKKQKAKVMSWELCYGELQFWKTEALHFQSHTLMGLIFYDLEKLSTKTTSWRLQKKNQTNSDLCGKEGYVFVPYHIWNCYKQLLFCLLFFKANLNFSLFFS